MARIAFPLSVAAIAALAACTTYDPNYPNQPVSSASGAVTAPASGTYVSSARSGVAGNPVVYAPATPNATGAVLTPAASASTFRAGTGIVESVQLVHINPAPGTPSSSSGSNMPQSVAYRLTVKMDDDGSLQAVDQDNSNFRAGDRVRLSGDGRIAQQ
jgi:outer membrane lipoprotein SlyB